jgi:hypothetical protein
MTTYYGLYGQKVQYLASDPTDVQIGQVWYNSTSATLKVRQEATVNAFSSGGAVNTARYGIGAAGTQTATIGFGGGFPVVGASESYNGTSWTSTPSLNNTRYVMGGAGTQTAALGIGGSPVTTAVEFWNGSSWTTNPSLGTARSTTPQCCGTSTATMAAGGGNATPIAITTVENYNGTSWTVGTALNTALKQGMAIGTQTANIVFGGTTSTGSPAVTAVTQSWNGSSWTTVPGGNMNSARYVIGAAGTQASGVAFGGAAINTDSVSAATELWNGSTWTSNPNSLATARGSGGSAGTNSAAIYFSGALQPGASTPATEEWTGIEAQTKTVTVS